MTKNEYIHSKLYSDQCWHVLAYTEIGRKTEGGKRYKESYYACTKCGKRHVTNPDYSDMPIQGIIARLVELGEWENLWEYSTYEYMPLDEYPGDFHYSTFAAWLCQQPRFSNLLLQYWGWEGELFKEDGNG